MVRGTGGLLVCDTRSSHRQADEIRADLRELGTLPVRWVVNTHAHFDHIFGNARFGPDSDVGAPIYGHVRVPAHLDAYERRVLAELIEDAGDDPGEWREVAITPPTVLVGESLTLDLGGTAAELWHLGRGHTDNDLLVHVPDAGVWLVGDLLEESGPPAYGPDSFPLDWPGTIARLRAALAEGDVLVPGHGAVVDAAFAAAQHEQLTAVAALITGLHAAGVPEDRAMAEGGARWPFPADRMADAVRRGYGQLSQPPVARRPGPALPLRLPGRG